MVHVKYPSMERQDLTQAQLGSFKFTPVDEAAPSTYPHHLTLQQYYQVMHDTGYANRGVLSPVTTNSPTLFAQQIAPSLSTSRLRLGPAAVRAAVESAATSPKKRFSHSVQATMRPDAQAFRPQVTRSENESAQSLYTSECNSMPMSLINNGSTASSSLHPANVHTSILKALESEQAAHQVTKEQLDYAMKARWEAEAETIRLTECNKGLLNSVNLLKSTVRHMVSKEKDSLPDQAVIEAALKQYNKDVENKQSTDSILYDVLVSYKTTTTSMENGEETITNFNLDLLAEPHADDLSERAQLQRTMRRQMGLSDSEHMKKLKDDYQHKIESIVRGNGPLIPDLSDTGTVEASSLMPSLQKTGQAPTQEPLSEIPQRSILPASSKPMLQLPDSFLSKYRKMERDDTEDEVLPTITPQKTNITAHCAIKANEFNLDPKRIPDSSKLIWMPDCPLIRWKIDNRHKDELRGKDASVKTRTVDSHFLDYPLRYIPNILDDNLYRTIMIDFIPFGTPYSDVLQQVRGGTLESIQMYGPIGGSTDFVTARVIYTDETGATALYRRGQDPGVKINGRRVRVWQVLEATYPKNKELEEAVYVHNHTRILVIHAPIDNIKELLKQKLRAQIEAGLVLDIGITHDGVPMVEFTSIEQSTKALKAFMDDRDLAGADFDFDDDYCNSRFPEGV